MDRPARRPSRRCCSWAERSFTSIRSRATMDPGVENLYHGGSRSLQDRFDTRRIADRLEEKIVRDRIEERRPRVHRGSRHVVHRHRRRRGPAAVLVQGWRSRIRVRASTQLTIAFPNYDGNGMYLTAGEHARQPERRAAVHRFRGAEAHALERRRLSGRRTTRCSASIPRRSS